MSQRARASVYSRAEESAGGTPAAGHDLGGARTSDTCARRRPARRRASRPESGNGLRSPRRSRRRAPSCVARRPGGADPVRRRSATPARRVTTAWRIVSPSPSSTRLRRMRGRVPPGARHPPARRLPRRAAAAAARRLPAPSTCRCRCPSRGAPTSVSPSSPGPTGCVYAVHPLRRAPARVPAQAGRRRRRRGGPARRSLAVLRRGRACSSKRGSPGPVFYVSWRVGVCERAVPVLQVPHHGRRRGRPPGGAREPQRGGRVPLQDPRRPASHADRPLSAADLARRAAAAGQRPPRAR